MLINKHFLLFLVILFGFSQVLFAQQNDNWTKIQNAETEFSAFVPSNFLVDKVSKNQSELHAFENSAFLTIKTVKTKGAKNMLQTYRAYYKLPDADISSFSIGDFIGDVITYKSDNNYSMTVYIAAPKTFYTLWVSAKDDTNQSLLKFLNLIRLGKQPLLKQDNPFDTESINGIEIGSLTSSPVITEALKKKDGGIYIKGNFEKTELIEKDKTISFSRPLIILRKPKPSYTDSARGNNISGNVKLEVQFKSDGQIGDIKVIESLDPSLDKEAVKTSQKIKFLPAEVDGKPTDLRKVVVYTFTIY